MLIIFFFNDTATTEIYTLSLHDALPIWRRAPAHACAEISGEVLPRRLPRHEHSQGRGARVPKARFRRAQDRVRSRPSAGQDRKSTRLNSSHANISYAVFCLKKKKTRNHQ